jgi:hypothetical protein
LRYNFFIIIMLAVVSSEEVAAANTTTNVADAASNEANSPSKPGLLLPTHLQMWQMQPLLSKTHPLTLWFL